MPHLQWWHAWPLRDSRRGSMLQAKVTIGPCATAQQLVGATARAFCLWTLENCCRSLLAGQRAPQGLAPLHRRVQKQSNHPCCKLCLHATCRTV